MSLLFRECERAGVAIADLRREDDSAGKRELIVEFMAAGAARDAAERALAAWASSVGFDRVWFPDGPVDLEGRARGLETASITCPTCGIGWTYASPSLWATVERMGHFPTACFLSGNGLPQWTVAEGDATRCRGNASTNRANGARSDRDSSRTPSSRPQPASRQSARQPHR